MTIRSILAVTDFSPPAGLATERAAQLAAEHGAVLRNRVMSAIGHGDPARQAVVQQDHVGADLLVVGKRRSSPVADFVFGSVAQRVLCRATRDVLVVPDDFRASTRAAARQRIEAERGDLHGALNG